MSYRITAPQEGGRNYLVCFQIYWRHQNLPPENGKIPIVHLEEEELSREKKPKMGLGRGRSLFD